MTEFERSAGVLAGWLAGVLACVEGAAGRRPASRRDGGVPRLGRRDARKQQQRRDLESARLHCPLVACASFAARSAACSAMRIALRRFGAARSAAFASARLSAG